MVGALVATLELVQQHPGVEAEEVPIGAQEALCVHGPGEQVPLLVLDRAQILGADLGSRLHLADVDPPAHPRLPQGGADLSHFDCKATGVSGVLKARQEGGSVVAGGARGGARGGRLGLGKVGQDPRYVGFADQHLAGLGAFVAGNDPAALEHVDQPPRARVAEP